MAQQYRGLGVSSGVAIGRVFLVHAEPLPVVPRPVPPERVEEEVQRFHQARDAARQELAELREQVHRALGAPYAGILEAQQLILDDPGLVAGTVERIRAGRVSARWALREVVAEVMLKFETVDDEYLRERGGELSDVQRRLQRLLRGERPHDHALPKGALVVVAHALGPSDAILLANERVVGLATDVGGRTAHTAILAQALALPAVVGLHDFSRRVREGTAVLLDGDSGEVTVGPDETATQRVEDRRRAWVAREREMAEGRDLPAVTRDGVEVVLRANVEFPHEVDRALRFGAQGVGLYRSEFLFLSRAPQLPTEEEHFESYREMARKVAPEPFVVRTLDLGGEKYFHKVLDPSESNPVLGLRGVRFCLRRPDIFLPQLRGLLRAAVEADNLRILLPMVTSADEVREVRRILAREGDALRAEGRPARLGVPLGVMIEVPAAAMGADVLALEADFFSIGTNDLIQYALAVDRSNESVSDLYQPLHPGVLRLLRAVLDAARPRGLPVALCGEMAADLGAVGLLVGLGLRELSVQPRAVALVRDTVRGLDAEECTRRAAEVVEPPTAADLESGRRTAP